MIAELNVTNILTAAYTANVGQLVQIDSSAGVITVTLPNAKYCKGQSIRVFDSGGAAATHTITVAASHSQSILGTATITANNGSRNFTSNGTNWLAY